MGSQTNGHAVKPGKGRPNGVISSQPLNTPKKATAYKSFSILARLFVWYTIFVALFQCPSSLSQLSDNTSPICKPYLTIRSCTAPYISPYYDHYLSQYVELARPYVGKLESELIVPAAKLGQKGYDDYLGPRVDQARIYSNDQWEKNVKPHFQNAQNQVNAQYSAAIAPHLDKVSSAAAPYYSAGKDNVLQTYNSHLLPAYTASRPYAEKAYDFVNAAVVETGYPYVNWVWSSSSEFLGRRLWPQVRILYGENVEPQLMRISQRLGRYRDGQKLKAIVDDEDARPTSEVLSSTKGSITSESGTQPSPSIHSVDNAVPSQAPEPVDQEAKAREAVTKDLYTWQERFLKAAEKGADDLSERVQEITDRQISNQVEAVGESFIVQLEEAQTTETSKLKHAIVDLIKSLPELPSEQDIVDTEDKVAKAVKSAATAVKSVAQSLRSWKQGFKKETKSLVSAASTSTLDVLDNIRDLGLQEIGMRWASMDGVTYRDWAKYHELKEAFDEWRDEVEAVVTNHEGLRKCNGLADELESKGLVIAEDTAKELARLKEVGLWKVYAQDASDDFTTRATPAKAALAIRLAERRAEALKKAALESAGNAVFVASSKIIGSRPGVLEQVSSSMSEVVSGSPSPLHESAISAVSEGVSNLGERASQMVDSAAQPEKESMGSVGSSLSLETSETASTSTNLAKKAKSSAESLLADAVTGASTVVLGTSQSPIEHASSQATGSAKRASSSAESLSSSSSSRIFAGAMAQNVVAEQVPILDEVLKDDDDDSYASRVQKVINNVGEKSEEVSKAAAGKYSDAVSAASAAVYGTPTPDPMAAASKHLGSAMESASSVVYGTQPSLQQSLIAAANNKYSSALSVASSQFDAARSAVGATSTPAYESLMSEASAKYSTLVKQAESQHAFATSALSSFVAGPTQGVLESISAMASSRLSEGLELASAQYESARTALGATPTPAHEQYLQEAKRKYYEGVGLAHNRYSEFLAAASQAVYGAPTPAYQSLYGKASEALLGTKAPTYETLLDAARSRYSSAASQASQSLEAALASASSAAGKTSKSPAQSVLAGISSQYSAVLSGASVTLASASSVASTAVYGTETGSLESIASEASNAALGISAAASQNWDALVSKASEQVYGKPTPFAESLYSQAGAFAAQATATAASQFSAVQVLLSELMVGKEPDFTESVMSRFHSAYYTGAADMASSASSYANEAYASASSAVTSIFTSPPALEAILASANDQVNAVIEAASAQVYGSSKGTWEQATSAAAESYQSAQSKISEAVYGTEPSYVEAAQSSIQDAAASAQKAISEAIYGTPQGTTESITSVGAKVYTAASSAASENLAAASSLVSESVSGLTAKVSSVIYGPEQGAVESASARLAGMVKSARSRLAEIAKNAGEGAADSIKAAQSGVEEMASNVNSVVESATANVKVKDEL